VVWGRREADAHPGAAVLQGEGYKSGRFDSLQWEVVGCDRAMCFAAWARVESEPADEGGPARGARRVSVPC
jgi:hypothetical protein